MLVGRINESAGPSADHVVPVNGQVAIRPMMLKLSLDHRAAQFLDDPATLIKDPWRLLV